MLFLLDHCAFGTQQTAEFLRHNGGLELLGGPLLFGSAHPPALAEEGAVGRRRLVFLCEREGNLFGVDRFLLSGVAVGAEGVAVAEEGLRGGLVTTLGETDGLELDHPTVML